MIKIFKDNYNKAEFYSIMGKFFAEPFYKRQLPYLSNRDNTVWFVDIDDETNDVISFNSYEEKRSCVEFKSTFYENNIQSLEEILIQQLSQLQGKVIETASSNKQIIVLFLKLGFEEYRKTTNYIYLIKEN